MKIIICFFIFISLFFIQKSEALEPLPAYDLKVSFDSEKNLLKGISRITISEYREMNISVDTLKIISISLNGQPVTPDIQDGLFKISGKGTLEIVYECLNKEDAVSDTFQNVDKESRNTVSSKGILLKQKWYPVIEGKAYYNLKALMPEGFIGISEADAVNISTTDQGIEYSFIFSRPLYKISLIANRYVQLKETYKGIDICGYFFPEDISLGKTYIGYAKKYLAKYGELLAYYPHKRFALVENFLPGEYSGPTFTIVGPDIVHLPSAVETFLSHQMLHQWFGHHVYTDYKKGDWSKGLVNYLSGHLPEGEKGWQSRKSIMIDYESFAAPAKEYPLRDFMNKPDALSKAIGFGKGAMLFHMLRNITGDDAFYQALKNLINENESRDTSWDDLKQAFEETSGKNLDWFFSQWLTRKGIPSIEVKDLKVVVLKGIPTIGFEIIQKGEPYTFNLSLMIRTDKGEITSILNIEKAKETFEIPVQGNPVEIVFDGSYDVMRKLSKEEYPPVISKLFGDDKKLIVIPEKKGKYTELSNILKNEGFDVKEEDEIQDEDIKTSSLLVLGSNSPTLKRLFGGVKKTGSGFTLFVRKNPLNATKVIAVAESDSQNNIALAAKQISLYGIYSFIQFENGKNINKQTDETERGIKFILYESVLVIQPQKTMKIEEVINTFLNKPIIYIGERHTNYEDHKTQLTVIMNLHEKGRKIAIGMEMFQRPFQETIDKYIAGAISEKEFLKASEYFKRWQFDYKLYREIMEFAQAKNIPVIALNQWSEITKKVSKEGLDGLTDAERAQIPEAMDMSDESYRERLQEVFQQHRNHESKNFENFHMAQILWDETMAHSIDSFLRKNPDYQIIVLAGLGHIIYDSGIPKRTYRLNGKDYVTLIPGSGSLNEETGDYLFSAEPLPAPVTFKLGIALTEINGRVKIDKIVPGGIAKSAGLKEGDILVSLDDWKIEDIADVNIFMSDKKRGDTITIKVLRKSFLTGYKEIVLPGAI